VTLNQFIQNADFKNYSLVTVNQESPLPAQSMLEKVFDDQPITVTEQQEPSDETDAVYLVEDNDVIASSPLKAIQESILLVNSDLYITGNREVSAVDPPDVISQLEDVRFELRGYPQSNNEKLLLIIISRYIERLAIETDNGRHRASFQRLSRLDDELGTKHVYEQLAESAVDTHVYGLPDWTPPPELEVTMHGGWSEAFQDSWFVVFKPQSQTAQHAALVALETSPNCWEAFWTYDTATVNEINRYIEEHL